MIPFEWLNQAAERMKGKVYQTPVIHDQKLNLFLKLENLQKTGSFKFRGALNRVMTLNVDERKRIVTASAGNHGLGVAHAVEITGGHATVFVSDHAVPLKINAIRRAGAEIREVRGGYGDAETAAMVFAKETGATWISPYNDGQVLAGQATAGIELIEQTRDINLECVIVPVGGGGLLAGIGLAFQKAGKDARLVGVNPSESHFLYSLFTRGSQEGVEDNPTLADGLSGAIDPHTITLPMLKQFGAEIILISEEKILEAVKYAWWNYGQKIEGSAAIALAAAIFDIVIERPAAIILTGGNIQTDTFESLINQDNS
jgi:threonine dehydratase